MTRVINLFGGPGTGKSTAAAVLFGLMKEEGHSVELVREYAKDLAWQQIPFTADIQIDLIANQYNREKILYGKVDWIITDSPLMLGHIYTKYYQGLDYMLPVITHLQEYRSGLGVMDYNFFLNRHKIYDERGRNESEEQAKAIDSFITSTVKQMTLCTGPQHGVDLFNYLNSEGLL